MRGGPRAGSKEEIIVSKGENPTISPKGENFQNLSSVVDEAPDQRMPRVSPPVMFKARNELSSPIKAKCLKHRIDSLERRRRKNSPIGVQSVTCPCGRIRIATAHRARIRSAMRPSGAGGCAVAKLGRAGRHPAGEVNCRLSMMTSAAPEHGAPKS
jgi:hypothetical protein